MKTTSALCASAIKKELKQCFPIVKFSVTSDNYSGGNSVNIKWINGPSSEKVEEITQKYQYGHFDGMQDLYEYSNKREDIPQAKYVSADRELSPELVLKCAQTIAKDNNLKVPETIGELSTSFDFKGEWWNFHQLVWKFCRNLDFTSRNSIRHIKNYCGGLWDCYETEAD